MKSPRSVFVLLVTLSLTACQPRPSMPVPPTRPPRFPKAVATPIDPALQASAMAEIKAALHSNDEISRAHGLETLADQHITDSNQEIIDALSDKSMLVRKAAALTAGRLEVGAAASRLQPLLEAEATATPAQATSATQERIAAIFALHRLGDTQYSHELETTAVDPRPPVRSDTAFVLGLLGEKSAVSLLSFMLHKDDDVNVRLQAAEAMWRLGDEQGRDALIDATVSQYASDKMIATLAMAEPRDSRMLVNVEGMFDNDYAEVKLTAARAAGLLGSDDGYGIAMEGAASIDPRQRALAALAFGAIGRSDSQPILAKMLKDTDPDVRIAAAGALVGIAHRQ